MSVLLAKLLWGVPAAIGTIGSLFFIVPRTRVEFASFMAIGLGCGIYLGPWLAVVPMPIVNRPMSETLAMFVSGLLGTVVLRGLVLAYEKLPLADIAAGWLSKKE